MVVESRERGSEQSTSMFLTGGKGRCLEETERDLPVRDRARDEARDKDEARVAVEWVALMQPVRAASVYVLIAVTQSLMSRADRATSCAARNAARL